MRLSDFTDYSLRVLMYCAANSDRLVTIAEIAQQFNISTNHLMKIVHNLSLNNYLNTTRGRNGGIRLNKAPSEINLSEVIKTTELDFRLVECFETSENQCVLTGNCKLQHTLKQALQAYLNVLAGVTLQDIASPSLASNSENVKPITLYKSTSAKFSAID